MMISIIIPAHNEEKLIVKTLTYLLEDGALKSADIIIICNGCIDNTFESVNGFISETKESLSNRNISIRAFDIEKPSKTNALNVGITQANSKNVILLDADIEISGINLSHIYDQLNDEVLVVSPSIIYDKEQSSIAVKAYYKVAETSGYNQSHRLSNVIALSERGLKRVGVFPEVIADDEYLRRQFKSSEYKIVSTSSFTFTCPKTLADLLNVMTRVERGNLQLEKLGYLDNSGADNLGVLARFSVSYLIFFAVKMICKLRAKWQYFNGNISQWERDESNR